VPFFSFSIPGTGGGKSLNFTALFGPIFGSGGGSESVGGYSGGSGSDSVEDSGASGAELSAGLLAADMSGFRRLDANEKLQKAQREYEDWLGGVKATYMKGLQTLPRSQQDLPADKIQAGPADALFTFDKSQIEALVQSRQALVLADFKNAGAIRGLMTSQGLNLDPATFEDVLAGVRDAEKAYYADLLAADRASTAVMGRSAQAQMTADAAQITTTLNDTVPPTVSAPNLASRNFPREADLQNTFIALQNATPVSVQGEYARQTGLDAVSAADAATAVKDLEAHRFYKNVAEHMLEITLGFLPVVGEGQCLYELVTGRGMITGDKLSTNQRAMAAVGLLTLGIAPSATKLMQWSGRLIAHSRIVTKIGAKTEVVLAKLAGTRWARVIANERGAVDFSAVNRLLTNAQRNTLLRIENIIKDHAKEMDFIGTIKEVKGEYIPNGRGGVFDHREEMANAAQGLSKNIRSLEGSLTNPNLNPSVRSSLEEALSEAKSVKTRMERALNGQP
jgi:hypothetical protein